MGWRRTGRRWDAELYGRSRRLGTGPNVSHLGVVTSGHGRKGETARRRFGVPVGVGRVVVDTESRALLHVMRLEASHGRV